LNPPETSKAACTPISPAGSGKFNGRTWRIAAIPTLKSSLHPSLQQAPKSLFPQRKEQPAKARCPTQVQAALHKARNSFIMPTRFHHRTAL